MKTKKVILADSNSIFTMDVGEVLRSNGFDDDFLTVLSTEEQIDEGTPPETA